MILNYVWKSDIDTSFATNLWFADSYRLKRWMAHHMPSRQWWAAGKWDDSCKEWKIKVERVREFYRETSTGSMEDKWFIPFWKIHSFRKYSSFCHFFPLFYCYIHDYWRREKERERKNKIYRVSVRNCKIRDVIFMSFLPRLRGWLNYEFFLISIRYV